VPAYSFSGEPKRGPFWKLIQSGEKTMTTRGVSKFGGPKVGDAAHLYWKQRVPEDQKPIHLIGRSRIIKVRQYSNMKVLLLGLGVRGAMEYIRAEGFDDLRELVEWWTGVAPSGYGIMDGGILLDEYTWGRLEESGPVEVIEWAYPFTLEEVSP